MKAIISFIKGSDIVVSSIGSLDTFPDSYSHFENAHRITSIVHVLYSSIAVLELFFS